MRAQRMGATRPLKRGVLTALVNDSQSLGGAFPSTPPVPKLQDPTSYKSKIINT